MKRICLFILISICCTNTSYQGLLFPINTSEVLTNNSDYHIFKNMILSKSKYNSFSSSYISFPNDISSNTLIYDYKITNLRMKSGIQIINFGNIEDAETGYSFSSQDYIFSHQFSKKIYHQLYSSVELNYLYSKIDNFKSSILTTKINVFYKLNRFIFNTFLDNYGKVINSYTIYKEKIPELYGYSLLVKPKNINVLFSLKQEFYINTSNLNISAELLLKRSSIFIGFSSIAQDLYFGDFYEDFFTGTSFGLKTQYKKFNISLGYQNLGPLGSISSLTVNKLIN